MSILPQYQVRFTLAVEKWLFQLHIVTSPMHISVGFLFGIKFAVVVTGFATITRSHYCHVVLHWI
jgi:hypothetical protein